MKIREGRRRARDSRRFERVPVDRGPIGSRRDVPPQRGGTLHLGNFSDVRNLDPALAFDTVAQPFLQLLYARLVDYDHEGNIVPLLAEHYEVSSDGKRYSFKLHEGVLFHDGTELTADDVKRSFERALDHETPCPAPSFYASIVGYAAFHDGVKNGAGEPVFAPHLDGVVVDGKYALHIDLLEPDATFLPVLTLYFVAPLCKSAGSKYRREWGNQACGAGPFKLVEWQSSREISLERHQGYFEPGLPYVDRIRWFLLMPGLTQRFKFEEGELDHIRRPLDVRQPCLPERRALEALCAVGARQEHHGDRPQHAVEAVRQRRAAAGGGLRHGLGADREEPRRCFRARDPDGPPRRAGLRSPVPRAEVRSRGGPRAHEGCGLSLRSRHRHRRLSRDDSLSVAPPEAGGATPLGRWPSSIWPKSACGSRSSSSTGPPFSPKARPAARSQMGYAGWSIDFPDASDFFEPILSTEAILDEDSQNMAFYSNPEFDQVLKKAHHELDRAARACFTTAPKSWCAMTLRGASVSGSGTSKCRSPTCMAT